MTDFREKASKLQKEIALYKRKYLDNRSDRDKEIENENDWGASYLCAELLEKSTLQQLFSISRKRLDKLYEEFNEETGRKCDVDSLFNRNWLRLVNCKVHIAGTIRFSIFRIEDVAGLDHEFKFLSEKRPQNGKPIPKVDFLKLVEEYQIQHNLVLDLDRAAKAHWIKMENSHVLIESLIYYEPLLKHINDFLFIKKLYDLKCDEKDRGICIPKKDLEAILLKHQTTFPQIPSLNIFLESGVFNEEGDKYLLNFRSDKMGLMGIVHDKTGALLWDKLINNASFKNDIERIRSWYDLMVYRNNWCDIGKFSKLKSRIRFLDAAMQVLLNEKDLSSGEDEFMKLMLDQGHRITDLVYVLSDKNNRPEFPSNPDLYYLYDGMNRLDDIWQGHLMWEQGSRETLSYFIHQIVRNEVGYKYERVFSLLRSGVEKPFLLWKTAFVIHYWEPDIIPILVLDESTASLSFYLLAEITSSDGILNGKQELFKKIANANFELLCEFLAASPTITNKDKAKIIFQCLLITENEKFKIVGTDLERQKKHKQESNEINLLLESVFEGITMPGFHFSGYVPIKHFLYPTLLNELYDQIINYNPEDYLSNNSITLPIVKLDMLTWVLRLVNIAGYDDSERAKVSYNISSTFLSFYLESMNCGLRKTWDYETLQFSDRVPTWVNMHANLELIEWGYLFIELENQMLLDEFLSPTELKFNKTQDKYDKFNGFVANKVRTHLEILLIGLNDLYRKKNTLIAKNLPITSVLDKLELKITFIVTLYCKENPEKARKDIFSLLLERTFWSTEREELLPIIGNTINRFKNENKTKIISELVQTDQIVRSFKLLDYLISENDKEILITLITGNNIEQFFSSSSTNDAEYVLQKLVEEKKFEEKARQALDIWENRKIKGAAVREDKHLILCFRMKLLLAYHELSEAKVDEISNPSLQGSFESRHFSPYQEKDFYKALIYFQKDEPVKAYNIFNTQLKAAKEERPTLAINSFAAKLKWAEQTSGQLAKRKLFQEAIEEWNEFESKLNRNSVSEIEYIKVNIWYNKLHAYKGLGDDSKFESEFSTLDKTTQLRPDFIELRIKNLMARNMHHEAEILLSEAEEYHRLNDGQMPDIILELRKYTDTPHTQKILQNQYLRIFSKPPEELVKILPGNINKYSSLKEFLLSEITGAGTDMLTYINSISDIKKEDKFSDLMILSLTGRFRSFGWHINPARGGFPGSAELNPGLIDFAISSAKERIAVCEALQLKGANRTELQTHNFKIFNYDPARNHFYIIVYFKGEDEKFNENWETYKTDITIMVIFPAGFELTVEGVVDISERFGTDTIKTAKSIHGIDTYIYHVFININYLKVPPPRKRKNKKASPRS
jgi:hypothetical protein